MTDSMNFGPEWLRNLSSEGSTAPSGTRYQLADYRYGREEMLALFEKGLRPPSSLASFNPLYSEQVLPPLALLPQSDEERTWSARSTSTVPSIRGRGAASLDRGARGGRGRSSYQAYRGGYDSSGGWIGGEAPAEWSPRKDYTRATSIDNWRRHRTGEEDESWRSSYHARMPLEKWGKNTSWRDGGDGSEERSGGPPDKQHRISWQEGTRGALHRRPWENEDNLPEWAMENSMESGGTFDSSGAFHGCSDDEQRERTPVKKDTPLQKSISQQNITVKTHPSTLPSSQSAISLSKPSDDPTNDKQDIVKKGAKVKEEKQTESSKTENTSKSLEYDHKLSNMLKTEQNEHKHQPIHNNRIFPVENNIDINGIHSPDSSNRVDDEFERSQEDFVTKLVIDEELPKKVADSFMLPTVVPPPNLAPPTQDNWYYQDPQGELQGPFPSSEMAEWFRAGYFTSALLVKRLCDEAFYRLGDLVSKCSGNPFQSNIRIAPLKQEIVPPVADDFTYQLLQQQLLRQQETLRALSQNEPPWGMPQQRELVSQPVLNHPQFFQQQPQQQHKAQPPPLNPLMKMINHLHQANILPNQMPGEKPQLDRLQALVQQLCSTNATGLPTNIPNTLQNSGLLNNYSNLPASLNNATIPVGFGGLNNSGLHNINNVLPNTEALNSTGLNETNRLPPRPNPLGAVDTLSTTNEADPLKNLLQQLQNKHQAQQLDSLWQQNQFSVTQPNSQWQPNEVPMSMWDLQSPTISNSTPTEAQLPTQLPQQTQQTNQTKSQERDRQKQLKENLEKEQKRKEIEEKQAKKEAEEKRKEEQRKQEAEKRAAEEKRKKEEDRIRKELEKAKKEAEEKRLRELEEKRKLKEQRKAEEETRRKLEEQRKLEETERVKRELREKEEQLRMKQLEIATQQQQDKEFAVKSPRVIPWSQPSTKPELSLADIQRAERERRSAELVTLQQQRVQQVQQEPVPAEKSTMQLNWTKKPVNNKSIKSLAEIQQEEQERLSKQTLELRTALKEKEVPTPSPSIVSATPWSGQGLSWTSTNQCNNNIGGFWDDASIRTQPNKPSALSKSSSTSAVKQVLKPTKHKYKKEEQQVMKLFNNGPATDEFTDWCTTTLTRLNSTVDIPTFINFLRDIESALEVKEYCKEYFGDVPATLQFVTQFLEKRRVFKPKIMSQADDMSSPAPALTPSVQHSTEFQEVKGKGKKVKKSKMIKVDARSLGFSVTAAPDRINVGARDYVEN